jgi:hypothetical protein
MSKPSIPQIPADLAALLVGSERRDAAADARGRLAQGRHPLASLHRGTRH